MANKGGGAHLKSLAAPAFWPFPRKERRWVVKPSPGPYPQNRCLPLLLVAREVLKFATLGREARALLAEGHIKVNGAVRRDEKFPVGLMDVVEIPAAGAVYRVIPDRLNVLRLQPIPREEANFKLCRIEGKSTFNGGRLQLHLHDGRNLTLPSDEAPSGVAVKDFKTFDTLKLELPSSRILDHFPLREGMFGVIVAGRNISRKGVIAEIGRATPTAPPMVKVRGADGSEYTSPAKYVFPVGRDRPVITLGE